MSQKQPEKGSGFFGHETNEDLNYKLNQILGLLQAISQKENVIMADLTNLQAAVTKLQADVVALIAKVPPDQQADVNAITDSLTALDGQVEAALNPPAPQPVPEAQPTPAG